MNIKALAFAAAAAMAVSAPASANTIQFGSGTPTSFVNLSERGPLPPTTGTNITVVRDFNTSATNPSITVSQGFTLYGSVTHDYPATNNYVDGFEMDFGAGLYELTFSFTNALSNPTDGVVSAFGTTFSDDTPYSASGNGSGSFSLGSFTGLVSFVIDPIFDDPAGTATNFDETIRWRLDVAPIPLPASALLLLFGLGGIAALRSRKSNA